MDWKDIRRGIERIESSGLFGTGVVLLLKLYTQYMGSIYIYKVH